MSLRGWRTEVRRRMQVPGEGAKSEVRATPAARDGAGATGQALLVLHA